MSTTIRITYDDLNTESKAEAFRDIFGTSAYHKARKQMAYQVHGGERQHKLERMVEEANEETFEKIRGALMEEMDKRVTIDEAYADVEVSQLTIDRLKNPTPQRKIAKEYLGEKRIHKVLGLDGISFVNKDSLRAIHPYNNKTYKQRQAEKRREEALAEKKKQQDIRDQVDDMSDDS